MYIYPGDKLTDQMIQEKDFHLAVFEFRMYLHMMLGSSKAKI